MMRAWIAATVALTLASCSTGDTAALRDTLQELNKTLTTLVVIK